MPSLGYLNPGTPEETVAQPVSEVVTSNSASLPSRFDAVFEFIAVLCNIAFQLPFGPGGLNGKIGLKDSEEAEYQRHLLWFFRTGRSQLPRPAPPMLG